MRPCERAVEIRAPYLVSGLHAAPIRPDRLPSRRIEIRDEDIRLPPAGLRDSFAIPVDDDAGTVNFVSVAGGQVNGRRDRIREGDRYDIPKRV